MSDRSYPVDAIGNPFKVGAVVKLDLPKPTVLCQVVKVDPAGTLSGPDGDPMALHGTITFQAMFPVQFTTQANVLDSAYVLMEPEAPPATLVKQ